jgi:8-oxo-dGTP pyrophosphatase MutT (NUDIX family)
MTEIRNGDIKARAGLIIRDAEHLLACKPTPSSCWPNPKLDIPKGHIQQGEHPMNAAIRECYEETNILFEPWKLNRPMRFTMEGEPLYLWEARLTELPPIEMLSCASTFVDDAAGQRHPEMVGYEYIPLFNAKRNGAFNVFQDRLRPCVEAYFINDSFYSFEDHRICADKLNLPDGLYTGLHTAYYLTLSNGVTFKTVWGVRGRNIPITVAVRGGLVYLKALDEDCQIAGPMMGDLPQNVGSTLSLGYKNGRILPSPKKRSDSKEYDSIPHF